jgi:hypothetical protein
MSNEIRVIIAGSRGFADYGLMKNNMDFILNFWKHHKITIISGTARGADQLGEQYAVEHGHAVERYPADWNKHGKSAGYKRNVEMADQATHCVVFQVGSSAGSTHMANVALSKGLPLHHFKL